MKAIRVLFLLVLLLPVPQARGDTITAEEYYYAIEINGTLCGYASFVTSPLVQGGREMLLLKHKILMQVKALGKRVESRLDLTYHINPATGRFSYHDSTIEQGGMRLFSKIRIEGGKALLSGSGADQEQAVPLPPDVVLANTLYFPHLVADFVERGLETKTYLIFDGRDARVQETAYTKAGVETIRRAGRTFETVVLDSLNKTNGMKSRLWLDKTTGIAVRTQHPNRLSYLADPSVVRELQTADLNPNLLAKTNVAIANPKEISYMRVRAAIDPSGLQLSPESLNVPGQRFAGTVKDNLIEGEFEIEHRRYEGRQAPRFPPDFSRDPAAKSHLTATELIQSDDPVLVEKAREITKGSADSWEAARRLSRWVTKNIEGAIPGGGTARGVFDTRSGECGGHSFLLAAFCRGVGIPARVVWGCMYLPSGGGVFGQHAWNEIYMGEAGWIPVDSTTGEADYVDSGHIRIGIHQSTTTALNARKIEILDYRGGAGATAEPAAVSLRKYEKYLGEYSSSRGSVKVVVQDGSLAVDIPGKVSLALNDPDEKEKWQSKLSDRIYVTFEPDESGAISEVRVHEIMRLRKTGESDAPSLEIPAEYRSYPGKYLLAQLQAEFIVLYENESLAIKDPLAKKTIRLKSPDKDGNWPDEFHRNTIRFEKNSAGDVLAMIIDSVAGFRRQ